MCHTHRGSKDKRRRCFLLPGFITLVTSSVRSSGETIYGGVDSVGVWKGMLVCSEKKGDLPCRMVESRWKPVLGLPVSRGEQVDVGGQRERT